MPLGFIKKLAGKLLGGSKPDKKALPSSPSAPKSKGQRTDAKGQRAEPKGQRGRWTAAPADKLPGGPRRPPRGPKKERTDTPLPPRAEDTRTKRAAPAADDGRRQGPRVEPVAGGARAIAKPPSKEPRQHRGRGPDGERIRGVNTDPKAQRPGGAAADAEVAKRLEEHAAWSIEQYVVEPAEDKKRFHDFDLPSELMHGVADMGFKYCTPIQALSLEHALAGKNVTGKAQTGTGKTAAFLVAILTRYLRTPESRRDKGGAPRALVIAPTRELVIQICKDAANIGKFCNLRSLAVYGGMDYDRQRREVTDAPVDLLVATPGRLLDFVRSRIIDLSQVDTLVIDEADRMLDMGFIPDVRAIVNRLPPKEKRCTMLYSATLDDTVMRLASQWMDAPVKVEVESEHVATKTVKQIVYVVTSDEKFTVLYNHIQQYPDSRTLIFCNRKHTTEDVADSLNRRGIKCEMLSGDVNQNRRLRVLEDFREGKIRIVVATDVAGRGLHVDDIGFVINFDFPYEPEDYVHRIGRTGRAGQTGTAISFADEDESFIIPDIEKYIGEELKCTVLKPEDALLTKLPPKPGARGHRSEGRGPQQRPAPAQPSEGSNVETEQAAVPQQPQQPQEQAQDATVTTADIAAATATTPTVAPEAQAEPRVEKTEEPVAVAVPAPKPPRPAAASHPPRQREERRSEASSRERPHRSHRPAPRTEGRSGYQPKPQSTPPPGTAAPSRGPRFSEEWVPGEK